MPIANAIAKLLAIVKLSGGVPTNRTHAVVRQVVDASLERVSLLVNDRVEGMTFSEARGYVRVRAFALVRKQARSMAIPQANESPLWGDEVARLATEQLLPRVLRETGVGMLKTRSSVRQAA